MKKVILLLLVALSLSASEFMCKDSFNRYSKHQELFDFAYERGDVLQMKVSNQMSIMYIEKTIATCGGDWKGRDAALRIRENARAISEHLKRL